MPQDMMPESNQSTMGFPHMTPEFKEMAKKLVPILTRSFSHELPEINVERPGRVLLRQPKQQLLAVLSDSR